MMNTDNFTQDYNPAYDEEKQKPLPAIALLLDSARGVYIPQNFAEFDTDKWHVSASDKACLQAGPEHEFYWETWDTVLSNAHYEHNGNTWRLYQDGDLWALCAELMTDEEKRNFGFDEE